MMRKLLAVLLALPVSAIAQTDTQSATALDLPAADVLRNRHIEAVGGRAALEGIRSSHAIGEFQVPAQGISGSLEVFAAAPNKLLVEIDIPGVGMVRNGYDGEVGWSIHPAQGPMVMDGRQLDQMRQQADFYGILYPERHIASLETVEEVEFAGRRAYKVEVVTNWDEVYFEFFEKESGLLIGNIREQESPMGAIEVTTVSTEYRDFGGIKAPDRVVQTLLGMEQMFVIERVEYDTVDEMVFALPDQIQTLVAAQ